MTTTRIDHCENLNGRQRLLASSLSWSLRLLGKPFFRPSIPVGFARNGLKVLARATHQPADVSRSPIALGGVPGECLRPRAANPSATVLYLHGGAYVAGAPASHRSLTGHLARACGQTVHAMDYRLAPENPYPAAIDDAVAAYLALLDNGMPAGSITLAGDSAGGGLSLATAMRLRDEGHPLPGALILLSPWCDLTLAASTQRVTVKETLLTWPGLARCARLYAGADLAQPYVSPLNGDFTGLPRTQIIVGTEEILLPDSERTFDALKAAGVDAHLAVYEDMWHVFPVHAGMLHHANDAIARMAAFIKGESHYPPEAAL